MDFKGEAIVEFYTTWCGECRLLEKELDKISAKIKIVKINADENRKLAKKYGVMSVPYMIYFKEDGSYSTKRGFINDDEILKWIGK